MPKKIQSSLPNSAPVEQLSSAQLHAEIKILREKITTLVEKKPKKAAIILADWLQRPALRKTYKKIG